MDWVKIAHQVLYGLRALHQCGKVHRDLKPENVLLNKSGTAVLTDFGISGDRNKRMTERNILGKPRQIFGTYAYMPPEQVKRNRGDATVLPTTDIFSFGVMMYQLLTGGNLPFEIWRMKTIWMFTCRTERGGFGIVPLYIPRNGTTYWKAV